MGVKVRPAGSRGSIARARAGAMALVASVAACSGSTLPVVAANRGTAAPRVAERDAWGPRPSPTPPAETSAPDSSRAADAASPIATSNWRDLVRVERWEAAQAALNALPDAEQRRPEMRLVRARVDLGLGLRNSALALLGDLERELPSLAEAVARMRIEAMAPRDLAVGGGRRVAKSTPKRRPPTPEERLAEAERTARSGTYDRAVEEIDRVAARKDAPPAARVALARARVAYASRRYLEAASAYDAIAAKRGADQAEALFYAARSRSRADQDDVAEARYLDLARRFPRSSWAEEATWLRARLAWLHGRFDEAEARYLAYARAWPRGRFAAVSRYERAIARLAAGKYAPARAELAALGRAAKSDGERARLSELEAVARLGAGDRDGAVKIWTKLAEAHPMSWPGLASRARLLREGIQPPELLGADARARTPAEAKLPPPAEQLHALGLDGDAEAWLERHERAALGKGGGSLCSLYAPIDRARRRFRAGAPTVPAAMLARAPSPSTEWAWSCAFPRPFAQAVAELEKREQLPAGLVHAVMRQESGFDPAIVSPARAVGLLQLMPETARRVAEEAELALVPARLFSIGTNLDLGARYLGKMMRSFGGSVPLAAAAYNAGPRAVASWLENAQDLDLDVWVARIPYDETRGYVAHVVANLARYAYLELGDAALARLDLALPRDTQVELSAY